MERLELIKSNFVSSLTISNFSSQFRTFLHLILHRRLYEKEIKKRWQWMRQFDEKKVFEKTLEKKLIWKIERCRKSCSMQTSPFYDSGNRSVLSSVVTLLYNLGINLWKLILAQFHQHFMSAFALVFMHKKSSNLTCYILDLYFLCKNIGAIKAGH